MKAVKELREQLEVSSMRLCTCALTCSLLQLLNTREAELEAIVAQQDAEAETLESVSACVVVQRVLRVCCWCRL